MDMRKFQGNMVHIPRYRNVSLKMRKPLIFFSLFVFIVFFRRKCNSKFEMSTYISNNYPICDYWTCLVTKKWTWNWCVNKNDLLIEGRILCVLIKGYSNISRKIFIRLTCFTLLKNKLQKIAEKLRENVTFN